MITKAYIHEYGNGKLEPEHADVKTVLESRGIPCELFTSKRLQRNQLQLDKNTLVVADHPTIELVFKRIGFKHKLNSYPISLRPYLKRNVWETSLGKLISQSEYGAISPIFIKPKLKAKLFTGFVIESISDLYKLGRISKNTELFCSSVVNWQTEYRVFIHNSTIVGIKNYDGNSNIIPDRAEIEKAVEVFEKSEDRTNGYSLDFGVLDDNQTALIEWNDGFALGSYGLDKELYTDLILARWNEILEKAFANDN